MNDLAKPAAWDRVSIRVGVVAAAVLLTTAGVSSSGVLVLKDAVLTTAGWADEATCRECHFEADTFPATGHAQSLRPASDRVSIDRLKMIESPGASEAGEIRVDVTSESGVQVVVEEGEFTRRMRLDWCFGSGHHAHTWVSTVNDLLGNTDELEFRWTWYHQTGSFGRTPGQPAEANPTHYGTFGVLFDGAKAVRCFSCHSSYIPAENAAIDLDGVVTSINCQRCHGPQQAHVVAGGEGKIDDWMAADRIDVVHRCGQCHRNADEMEPGEIRRDNRDIVRFQPVGLLQSPCFTQSEMTCTTCHNPHKSLASQDSRGIWQCVQCHDPDQPQHSTCAAGNRDDCLRCHMPALPINPNLSFTDHWIRIREDWEADK